MKNTVGFLFDGFGIFVKTMILIFYLICFLILSIITVILYLNGMLWETFLGQGIIFSAFIFGGILVYFTIRLILLTHRNKQEQKAKELAEQEKNKVRYIIP